MEKNALFILLDATLEVERNVSLYIRSLCNKNLNKSRVTFIDTLMYLLHKQNKHLEQNEIVYLEEMVTKDKNVNSKKNSTLHKKLGFWSLWRFKYINY
jgi:hypothetical protein